MMPGKVLNASLSMPLKEKNNMRQSAIFSVLFFTALFMLACKSETKISEDEQQRLDSLSRAEQRLRNDSLKKTNPLLILPPDSEYTGSYVDKYPGGITKFRGYYRFGQRHGQWVSFYPTGLPWSEMHYDKGLKQGPNIAYYENGKIRYTGFFKNDQQDSVWTYFDSTGSKAAVVLWKENKVLKNLPLE
jgi:antitoxin component YwqK of YwqJK toxin-antitoxin module